MSAPRFYHPENLEKVQEVCLSLGESHHLVKVLRIRNGENIELVNGKGIVAVGHVIDAHATRSKVLISEWRKEASFPGIHLCFGFPKGLALDFIFRRCAEIGVDSFQPLTTEFSLKPGSWNAQRWEKVVVEVCKQCEATFFPKILAPANFTEWLSRRDNRRLLIVCDDKERAIAASIPRNEWGYDLLIGPEGGWSPRERESIYRAGAKRFGLGPQRLRSETAALVAITLLKNHIYTKRQSV